MEKEQNINHPESSSDESKNEAKELDSNTKNSENESQNKEQPIEKSSEERILELEDKVARTFAEMENQRRRFEKEKEEAFEYGGFSFAREALNLIDNLERSKQTLENDETLLVQSGKPVGIFKTHSNAPRVLIANSNLVGKWANWEHFDKLEKEGLMMYGQMTAGSWIYIGSQGILQGTFETFAEAARQHFSGNLEGKLVVTGGLGGMGGAQLVL